MANQTISVRLANADHPNGQRIVGGVTVTRKWTTATVTEANAAIIAADTSVVVDATAQEADALTGADLDAVATTVPALLEGIDISVNDGDTIVERVASAYRTVTE